MTEALNPVLDKFAQELLDTEVEYRSGIRELADALVLLADDSELENYLADCLDDIKSKLGARVANSAGDDRKAQEDAISEVEAWLSDNVSNEGLDTRISAVIWLKGIKLAESELRALLPQPETVRLRLTLDVTYTPNGVLVAELIENLQQLCERAIGEGLLTGASAAEVEEHSMAVEPMPDSIPEEDIADWMLNRIESGDLPLEDIPNRLAAYGLMEPQAFLAEMQERMAHAAESSDAPAPPQRHYSVDLVINSGTNFQWSGMAATRKQAMELACEEATRVTGEDIYIIRTVVVN